MHGLNFVTRSLCPGRPSRSRRYSPHALPERRAWKLHKTERGRRSMDNCRQPPFKKPMKNNLSENTFFTVVPEAPYLPSWPFPSPPRKPGFTCMAKSACLRQGKPFSCMTPPDSPSGDIPHADGPFTPIPLQAPPFTLSGASTAAAMFLHGTPGRIITALSGRRASAASPMPHALGHVHPLSSPTAPDSLTKDTLPVSTAGKPAQPFLYSGKERPYQPSPSSRTSVKEYSPLLFGSLLRERRTRARSMPASSLAFNTR